MLAGAGQPITATFGGPRTETAAKETYRRAGGPMKQPSLLARLHPLEGLDQARPTGDYSDDRRETRQPRA